MSTAQALPSSDSGYFSQFKTEIHNGLRTGTDCEGNSKKYVPYRVLVDYWTPQNIADILRQHLGERAEYIFRKDVQEKYLRGLSILAFASTSRKAYIDELPLLVNAKVDDDRLASEEPEKCLSPDAWGVFKNLRWKFCPISLEYDGSLRGSLLHPHRIFPGQIRTPESLGRSEIGQGRRHPDAEFQFLELEECKHPGKAPERLTGMAVIKSYPAAARDSWSNETVFFGRSEQSRRRPDNIVRCLGFYSCDSPTKGLRHNIVLEYARRGSLQEFLTVETPPRTAGDISAFWRSIVPFLCGLEYIHNRDHSHEEVASVHQDVKPSNLLVFPGPKGRFDFVLKICDFGLGTTKGKPASLGPHRDGSSEFSSPEKFFANAVEYPAHPTTDMWAAACVILEMAAWVRNGFEGQEQFKRLRHDEIERTAHDMYKRGHRYCYHNGSSALDCVLDASTSLAGIDELTLGIVNTVVEGVFAKSSHERCSARSLLQILRRIIPSEGRQGSSNHSSRENRPRLSATQQSRASGIEIPVVTWEHIMEWKRSRHTIALKGQSLAWSELGGRDHIIIIDNSKSMQVHKSVLLEKLYLIAYVLKHVDPDRLEVMMTSGRNLEKLKTATDVRDYVSDHFADGKDAGMHMETCLRQISERVTSHLPDGEARSILAKILGRSVSRLPQRSQTSKRISVYFLTDGVWVDSLDEADVKTIEKKIRIMVEEIEKHRRGDRQFLSLQFIRFGNHDKGIEMLDHLDDLLSQESDCIDHKPIDYEGGVWHILIGSLIRSIDKSASPTNTPVKAS